MLNAQVHDVIATNLKGGKTVRKSFNGRKLQQLIRVIKGLY